MVSESILPRCSRSVPRIRARYRYGEVLKKNENRGLKLEMTAARQGVPDAQFAVGCCLSQGQRVKSNPKEALRWYIRAARKGHKEAAYNAAHLYETGRGVRADLNAAIGWYRTAARLGDPEAQRALDRLKAR